MTDCKRSFISDVNLFGWFCPHFIRCLVNVRFWCPCILFNLNHRWTK
jgi:hypothetical protein